MDIAILFSGRGSNMRSIIERSLKEDAGYNVKVVITDNPNAPGIKISHDFGKPCVVMGENWEWHIYNALNYYGAVRFVVLAGFMRILPALFCRRWESRCINIHPSILPKYKGLHTHRKALDNKDTEHGCTIHYVTSELDSGLVIANAIVPIIKNDTEESLAARVLEQETKLYPEVIQAISCGRITTDGKEVSFMGKKIKYPLSLDQIIRQD